MSTTPTIADLRRVLSEHLDVGRCRCFLFGSRAQGTARDYSDWDIGVISDEPLPGRVLERTRQALEDLPTLHTVELVDFDTVSPEFRAVALRHTISLVGWEGQGRDTE